MASSWGRFRRWAGYLIQNFVAERKRRIRPAFARPEPDRWPDSQLTLAWLGHATVLFNFMGVRIITDPALFNRIGIRLPGLTLGPKRLTAPGLEPAQLPPVDLVLLSHAHFDHLDTRTLHRFGADTQVVTASRTADLLRWMRFGKVVELRWGESVEIATRRGSVTITALRVNHWGARLQTDDYRGYNGYLIERAGRRLLFAGDTALTKSFAELRRSVDIAIFPIGCYDPWIRTHCTPEEAVQMADQAGARFVVPVHHQTFRLSNEPLREPITRFEKALSKEPERIALREIGETFCFPGLRMTGAESGEGGSDRAPRCAPAPAR